MGMDFLKCKRFIHSNILAFLLLYSCRKRTHVAHNNSRLIHGHNEGREHAKGSHHSGFKHGHRYGRNGVYADADQHLSHGKTGHFGSIHGHGEGSFPFGRNTGHSSRHGGLGAGHSRAHHKGAAAKAAGQGAAIAAKEAGANDAEAAAVGHAASNAAIRDMEAGSAAGNDPYAYGRHKLKNLDLFGLGPTSLNSLYKGPGGKSAQAAANRALLNGTPIDFNMYYDGTPKDLRHNKGARNYMDILADSCSRPSSCFKN